MSRKHEIWDTKRSHYYTKTYGTPDDPKQAHAERMVTASNLVEGNTVLDVACGVGHLYPYIIDMGLEYTGLDNSQDMLDRAREAFPEGSFNYGDIYDLTKHGIYDTVIAQSILIHLPDTEKPLRQMWEHTRKTMIFSIPIGNSSTVRVWQKFDDKNLLAHSETIENIKKIVDKLENAYIHTVVRTPSIGNTYFKVNRTESY